MTDWLDTEEGRELVEIAHDAVFDASVSAGGMECLAMARAAVTALLSPVSCPECGGSGTMAPFDVTESRVLWRRHGPCRACTSTGSLPPLVVLRTEHDAKVAAMDDEVEAANDNALRAVERARSVQAVVRTAALEGQ